MAPRIADWLLNQNQGAHPARKKNELILLKAFLSISQNSPTSNPLKNVKITKHVSIKSNYKRNAIETHQNSFSYIGFYERKLTTRLGCFDVTVILSWGWLKLRLIEFEVDESWGWLKLRLIEVEVDRSWGWSKLRLIKVEVVLRWSWLKLRLIKVEFD